MSVNLFGESMMQTRRFAIIEKNNECVHFSDNSPVCVMLCKCYFDNLCVAKLFLTFQAYPKSVRAFVAHLQMHHNSTLEKVYKLLKLPCARFILNTTAKPLT